jgi:tRNA wybutosine-synthesizing protein 3
MPVVAIRSMGLGIESLIGVEVAGRRQCTVSNEYLQTLVELANERFEENARKIERFRQALANASHQLTRKNRDGLEWEDAAARRVRKRAEGLARSAILKEDQKIASQ